MADLNARHRAFIGAVLQDKFRLQQDTFVLKEIETAKNNHVYSVELAHPIPEALVTSETSSKRLTSEIPANTTRLLFRIFRENVSLVDSVRVRNEVTFLFLARDALSAVDPSLIPLVFGWGADVQTGGEAGFHWIAEEWKEGQSLTDEQLKGLDEEVQVSVLKQIVAVVKAFQNYKLPATAQGFGGLTFDEKGTITNTTSTIPCDGPFTSYAEFLKGMLKWLLEASDRSVHINGWLDVPGLRQRIDALFATGIDGLLAKIPEQKPTLVHGDLTFPNLLFDHSTYRLTGVLDFDFSHTGAPVSEYLFSFLDTLGLLTTEVEPLGPIYEWTISGFPAKVDDKYKVARLWDSALADAGVQKPSTIEQARHIGDVWWFSQDLCQSFWFIGRYTNGKSAEQLAKMKAGEARNLEKHLTRWGF